MASMISSADGRVSLSAGSVRTVLDSVGARMSEAGAFTRYFGRLLIFLGLLGTFGACSMSWALSARLSVP